MSSDDVRLTAISILKTLYLTSYISSSDNLTPTALPFDLLDGDPVSLTMAEFSLTEVLIPESW